MPGFRNLSRTARRSAADMTSVGASFLCLVHCLMLPLVIALFPALGEVIGLPEKLHLLLFLAAIPISALAIVAGYRRHGAMLPGVVAVIGLALIGVGATAGFTTLIETSVTVIGSVLLAAAHLRNWRLHSPEGARGQSVMTSR